MKYMHVLQKECIELREQTFKTHTGETGVCRRFPTLGRCLQCVLGSCKDFFFYRGWLEWRGITQIRVSSTMSAALEKSQDWKSEVMKVLIAFTAAGWWRALGHFRPKLRGICSSTVICLDWADALMEAHRGALRLKIRGGKKNTSPLIFV